MSNTLYETTKQINDLIPQLKEKYGMPNYHNFTGAIQAPHIRQILFELKDVLDVLAKTKTKTETNKMIGGMRAIGFEFKSQPQLKAESLCHKWLDGLTPLIDTEPEKVLTELLEILKKLV
jgi:hypothetical protein